VRRIWVLLVAVGVVVGACADDGAQDGTARSDGRPVLEGELTVFAAASLTDAFGELADRFEALNPGATVTTSFAASTSLREQIREGAPADVFAAAAPDPLEDLAAAGDVDRPVVFATNRLQLAVPAGNPGEVRGLPDLAREGLLVGLCAPEVPCGAVAADVLDAAGVDPAPDSEEADARALLAKLAEAELDAGLVYATDVRAADGRVVGIDLPAGIDAGTELAIAVVAGTGRRALAEAFVGFVVGDQGQAVLRAHGFGPP